METSFFVVTGSDALIDEPLVLVQGLVSLSDDQLILLISSEVAHIISDAMVFLINTAIRSLHETELVHTGIGSQGADQTDVRSFRGLNRAHTAVMGVMNIANLETCAFAGQAARAQGRQTALMGKLRQGVMLIHELGQLGGTEELLHRSHHRTDIDKSLGSDDIHILDSHALAHHTLHAGKTDAELVLQKFAHSTDTAVAQMVNIIGSTHFIHEIQQVVDRSHDIIAGDGAVMHLQGRRAQKLHLGTILLQEVELDDIALTKNLAFTLYADSVQHFLGDNFLGRNDDLTGGSVHDRLSQDAAADAALPAQLLGELVTAHGSQVIALGVEKERIQELLGVVLVGRLTGAQTLVNLHHSLALALDLLAVTLDGGSDARVIAKELQNLLVRCKAQSTDEIGHGHLAGAVDADRHNVVGIRLQLNPSTAVRNDRGVVELLAGGVDLLAIVRTGRTNQLADDDTLCTIDDEGTGIGHQGEIPHENFLLLDLAGLAIDETDIDAQGSSPGHITFLALIEVILRLSHRKAFKGEYKISREILDWRNVTEDFLQPLIQEPLVARPLDIQQVRHFHDFLDSGVAIPGSFAHRHRIKH